MARVIKFRNYRPYDETLIETLKKQANGENMVVDNANEDNTEAAAIQQDPILRELEACKSNSNEINIVPMKENSDLKQLAASRLAKLRKRTNRAIVTLLRDKVSEMEQEE
jgi:hypothetical protein